MKSLSGKIIKKEIGEALKERIQGFDEKLSLSIIQIGNREDSTAYIEQKNKFGEEIGVDVSIHKFSERTSEDEVISLIEKLNSDNSVTGIIVQLPIPEYLDEKRIINSIDVGKDVDGLTFKNLALLYQNKRGILPATARAVMTLVDYYDIEASGKNVVVVGRSMLAGKPIAMSFLNRNATVTICHSQTKDLPSITKTADIIVVATGVKHLIKKEHVKDGQIVIDVGIHSVMSEKGELEIANKKYTGDVDSKEVSEIVEALSPVPGGVGQLTVACLFENLLDVYREANN